MIQLTPSMDLKYAIPAKGRDFELSWTRELYAISAGSLEDLPGAKPSSSALSKHSNHLGKGHVS